MLKTILEKMKKKWKLSALLSVIIIAGGFLGWYLLSGNDSATAEAATATVRNGTIQVTVSGTGAVQPIMTRSITPNQSGTIASIKVKNGQQVKKGDLLFELKNDNVETEIKKAQLDLRQSQLDYNTRLDELKQQYVYAPINGQISIMDVDRGQNVQKNAILMTINDTSKLTVKIPVNGAQINQIKAGQEADVTISALMSTVQGRVRKVNRGGTVGSDGSIMYSVTVEITNPGALAPGLSAQAVIHTAKGPESGYEAGTLEWAQTITLRAGVSGNIEQLYVDENDNVKKGQKLAHIAGDNTDTALESQQLRLEQARLSLEQAQKKLADCQIYTPVDGIINLSTSDTSQGSSSGGANSSSTSTASSGECWQVGDQVSTNQVLATLVDNAGMGVTVPVDEVDIAKVKMGQKATITVDALPDQTFAGTVTEIAAKGTEQNGVASFDVTVSMGQPEGLKENMTANVEIMIAKKEGALLLPVEAVQERQGRKFVQVPTSGDNSNRAFKMVPIETGLYNDTMIEITSGLQEGDIVNLPSVAKSSGTGSANARGDSNRSGGFGMPGGSMVRPR